MNKKEVKIASVIGLVLLAGFGYLFLGQKTKLAGTLTEIPPQVKTYIGWKYYHKFQNNETKEIVIVDATEEEILNLQKTGAGKVGKPGYTWLQSEGGQRFLISEPILKDNQYFKTGGKNAASTSMEVKVKLPNKAPELKYENELLSIKNNGLFSLGTAFAATPVVEASSTGIAGAGSSVLIFNVSVPASLTNSFGTLFVIVNDGCTTGQTITTKIDNTPLVTGGGDFTTNNKCTYWSYLVNPTATTSANITITLSASASIWGGWAVTSDVNQTTPVSASSTLSVTKSNESVVAPITSVLNELLLEFIVYESAEDFTFPGANQVSVFGQDSGSGQHNLIGDRKTATSTGANSMIGFISGGGGGGRVTSIILSISEPAAATSPAELNQAIIFEE